MNLLNINSDVTGIIGKSQILIKPFNALKFYKLCFTTFKTLYLNLYIYFDANSNAIKNYYECILF